MKTKRKKGPIIAGIVAVVGAVATIVGFISDIIDLSGPRKEKDTVAQVSEVSEIITTEYTTETIIPTEEITTTTTSEITTTTEEVTTTTTTTQPPTEPATTAPAYIPLSNLEAFNGGWEWNNEAPVDPWGNDYSDACNYRILNGNEAFSEYYTNGQYKKLTFNLAPHTDTMQNNEAYVQVYKDEELVYTSPVVARKTQAFSCEVDISGAEYIEIYLINDKYYGGLIFSDAKLWTE